MTNLIFDTFKLVDNLISKSDSVLILLSREDFCYREQAAFLYESYMASNDFEEYVRYIDCLKKIKDLEERMTLIRNRCDDTMSQYNILDANLISARKEILIGELNDPRMISLYDIIEINSKNIENLIAETLNFLSDQENLSIIALRTKI